jgi:hypothetical protein
LDRQPELEGLEVVGCASQLVDHYEWVLTRLCSLISAVPPDTFNLVEEALLREYLVSINFSTASANQGTDVVYTVWNNTPWGGSERDKGGGFIFWANF